MQIISIHHTNFCLLINPKNFYFTATTVVFSSKSAIFTAIAVVFTNKYEKFHRLRTDSNKQMTENL
jgi:hypothetical protein